MSAAVVPDGSRLTHLGLVYESTEELVDTALLHLQNALGVGDAVVVFLDRSTSRRLRDRLGDLADRVDFLRAHHDPAMDPATFLQRLRRLVEPAGRSLVLAQSRALMSRPQDCELGEDGINLMLPDLALTMICAYPGDTRDRPTSPPGTRWDGLTTSALDRHPYVAHRSVTRANARYRPPTTCSPTGPGRSGATHLRRFHVESTDDLRALRALVNGLATSMSLSPDDVGAAVFAVHEAALVVRDEIAAAGSTAPCVIDLWRLGDRLIADVRGPRSPTAPPPVHHDIDPGESAPWHGFPHDVPEPLSVLRTIAATTVYRPGGEQVIRLMLPA